MSDLVERLLSRPDDLNPVLKQDAAAEIVRLRRIVSKLSDLVDWLDRSPDTAPCDFKCGYGKEGDASACYCGRAEWEKKRPAFVDDITHKIDEDFSPITSSRLPSEEPR